MRYRTEIIDLCGGGLCIKDAGCSFIRGQRRVFLCLACLRKIAEGAEMPEDDIVARLIGFEWEQVAKERIPQLVADGLTVAQAVAETIGAREDFVVRASGHPTERNRSWTRANGVAAGGVMRSAKAIGWSQVVILYRASNGQLVDVTDDIRVQS